MKIVKDEKSYNKYLVEVTEGELMALWQPLEKRRLETELSHVGYDCWLQLNRIMETIAPDWVNERR